MHIIAWETYLCQPLSESGFKHPNTIKGIRANHGINIVPANHGLMPASRHRLAVVASTAHANAITPPTINNPPTTEPTRPPMVNIMPTINIGSNSKYEMILTPQYSLRVAVPVKKKYFSILFITLTSLLIQHYQLLQVACS